MITGADVQQLTDILLDVAERAALRRPEAHRAGAGRDEPHRGLQGDGGGRHREEVVQLRWDRLGPAEQGVEESHGYLASCSEISDSCRSRRSSEGWVEKRVARLAPALPDSAGAK